MTDEELGQRALDVLRGVTFPAPSPEYLREPVPDSDWEALFGYRTCPFCGSFRWQRRGMMEHLRSCS